jgi:phospholipid/cholesterol/gamma-HCH transport system ATP-binding protein
MTEKPAIEISNLNVQFHDQIILRNLNLKIYKHQITAIVGPSGTGKTTLLRSILMLQPATGSIKIEDKEILHGSFKDIEKVRKSWGVMFQHGALFSSLTVLENVMFPLQENTDLNQSVITDLAKLRLASVGLSMNTFQKYPSELSGGMQKRAAIARAIALDPHLLFLDEPTAGLDPQGASSLDELVLHLKSVLGLTIVIVTHDLDTLWRVTDQVAFMGEYKILQVGTMNELFHSNVPLVKNYFSDQRSMIIRRKQEKENDGNSI